MIIKWVKIYTALPGTKKILPFIVIIFILLLRVWKTLFVASIRAIFPSFIIHITLILFQLHCAQRRWASSTISGDKTLIINQCTFLFARNWFKYEHVTHLYPVKYKGESVVEPLGKLFLPDKKRDWQEENNLLPVPCHFRKWYMLKLL